jgi:hypothetical protein
VNTRNPILIVAVAFALVGFGFYNFAIKPKQEKADTLASEVADAQSRLDAAQTLLASNEQAKKSFRDAYETVVRLGKAVPGDDDVRSLLVQLNRAAENTFVDFQSIEVGGSNAVPATTSTAPATTAGQLPPGATVGPAGFPMMPLTFSFRGNFFRLSKFFQRLDAFVKKNNESIDVTGRLLTVDTLRLEPDDITGFPNIKASVQATSYLVSPLEGATGGATPAGPAGTTADTAAAGVDAATTPPTTTASIR